MDVYYLSIDITSLRDISRILSKSHFPNMDLSFYPEDLPTGFIHLTINAIKSKVNTSE